MPGGGRYWPVEAGGTTPGYVTWDGNLDAALNEIHELMDAFYLTSETSRAAFGQLDAGAITSGAALRRLMMAPLAKVNRIRLRFDPRLKDVLMRAAMLEDANHGQAVVPKSINIEWRDGLPEDPQEQTAIVTQRYQAGLMSKEAAIRVLDGGTADEIRAEIDRIALDEANQAATTSTLLPGLRINGGNQNVNGNQQPVNTRATHWGLVSRSGFDRALWGSLSEPCATLNANSSAARSR